MVYYFNIRILLVSFFTIVAVYSQAQKKYDWSKYENLTFKNDVTAPSLLWGMEKPVLQPIEESKANIEIRCYVGWYNGEGTIYVLKCFNDSVIYDKISGSNTPKVVLKPGDSIFYNNGGGYYDWRVERLCIDKKVDKLMDTLIEKKLLALADIQNVKTQLQNKYYKDITPDSLTFNIKPEGTSFAIKIGDKFKTIDTYLIRYDGPGKFNGGYYLLGRDLSSFFINQFDNAKIKNSYSIYSCRGFRLFKH